MSCAKCDSGFVVEEREGMPVVVDYCECRREIETAKKTEIVQNIFGHHMFAELSPEQKRANQKFSESEKTSLWLTGRSGAGKSALCYTKLVAFPGTVAGVAGIDVDRMFRTQLTDGTYVRNEITIDTDVFAIDDIDKRVPYTDATKRDIYELIERLCRSEVRGLITSNIALSDWCAQWPWHMSEPIERRIRDKFEVLEL